MITLPNIELRDGSIAHAPNLGYIREIDERSRDHSIYGADPPDGGIDLSDREIVSRVWITDKNNPKLAQDDISACVLITIGNALNHQPWIRHHPDNITSQWCLDTYDKVQREDQWPGPTEAEGGRGGTSILAALKWLKRNGYIDGWKYAFSLKEALIGWAYYGPPLFGSMWTHDMINAGKDGLCHPTGRDIGGHAVMGGRLDWKRKRVSGPNWPGINKDIWEMTINTFEDRLHNGGECAFMMKKKPC